MEYAAYITAIGALLVCFFLHRRRKRKLFARAFNHHYTIRTFEKGGDPIDDRIEFHFVNRRKD